MSTSGKITHISINLWYDGRSMIKKLPTPGDRIRINLRHGDASALIVIYLNKRYYLYYYKFNLNSIISTTTTITTTIPTIWSRIALIASMIAWIFLIKKYSVVKLYILAEPIRFHLGLFTRWSQFVTLTVWFFEENLKCTLMHIVK